MKGGREFYRHLLHALMMSLFASGYHDLMITNRNFPWYKSVFVWCCLSFCPALCLVSTKAESVLQLAPKQPLLFRSSLFQKPETVAFGEVMAVIVDGVSFQQNIIHSTWAFTILNSLLQNSELDLSGLQ